MAVWEKATLVDGPDPGSTTGDPGDRITVSGAGVSWVKILSPSFRRNDGADFSFIGYGNRLIQ